MILNNIELDLALCRLEEQFNAEIDSYRSELNKRQREVDDLRRQLSENRRAPSSKNEVHLFMQELQIRDNRLADEIEVSSKTSLYSQARYFYSYNEYILEGTFRARLRGNIRIVITKNKTDNSYIYVIVFQKAYY